MYTCIYTIYTLCVSYYILLCNKYYMYNLQNWILFSPKRGDSSIWNMMSLGFIEAQSRLGAQGPSHCRFKLPTSDSVLVLCSSYISWSPHFQGLALCLPFLPSHTLPWHLALTCIDALITRCRKYSCMCELWVEPMASNHWFHSPCLTPYLTLGGVQEILVEGTLWNLWFIISY